MIDIASLNGWCLPAVIAWKRWPKRMKSTTFTEPAGPDGESFCIAETRTTRERGKIDA